MDTTATIISKHKGYKLYQLLTVDSTNNYAAKLSEVNALSDYTVILAYNQTQGRGQRGNVWQSEPGENLTVSVIVPKLNMPFSKHFYLSMAVALSVHDLLKWFIKGVVWLKWPNDIFVSKKKIGGLLIENSIQNEEIKNAIIGLGLNVNQKSFGELVKATSLIKEVQPQEKFDVAELVHQWVPHLKRRVMQLQANDYDAIKKDYLKRLLWRNETQQFEYKGKLVNATITNVTDGGLLVLVTTGGKRIEADLKEIKHI